MNVCDTYTKQQGRRQLMMKADGIHIILADDDEDDRFFFRKALEAAKIQSRVKTFDDGEKVIAYLMTHKTWEMPDVIFLDHNMPRKNGLQCLAELRTMDKLVGVPIIMFSTSSDPHHVQQAIKLGANRYMRKPYTLQAEEKMFRNIFLKKNWKELLLDPSNGPFLIVEEK